MGSAIPTDHEVGVPTFTAYGAHGQGHQFRFFVGIENSFQSNESVAHSVPSSHLAVPLSFGSFPPCDYIIAYSPEFVNTFSKVFLKKFSAGGRGSRVLLDPVISALLGLEGLDEDFPPLGALIHSEPTACEFPNLVSHFCFLPSLDGLIIAWIRKNVNYFFKKKFFSTFFKKPLDITGKTCYN